MSSDFDGELLRSEVSKFSMRSHIFYVGSRGILGGSDLKFPSSPCELHFGVEGFQNLN